VARHSGADRHGGLERNCLEFARTNDVVTVTELWRLGRNFQDLISIVSGLRQREIGFKSLHEALDTTTPGGRMIFRAFAALGEFIREMIVQGTREGLDAAVRRGKKLARPPAMNPERVQQARDPLGNPDKTGSRRPTTGQTSVRRSIEPVTFSLRGRRRASPPLSTVCFAHASGRTARQIRHSCP
jgi:DNA invertase Pin-like site-specific DNA recombinase